MAADLGGGAKAAREVAARAQQVAGGRVDILMNNAAIGVTGLLPFTFPKRASTR